MLGARNASALVKLDKCPAYRLVIKLRPIKIPLCWYQNHFSKPSCPTKPSKLYNKMYQTLNGSALNIVCPQTAAQYLYLYLYCI